MTPHIEAKLEDIKKIVLMPGDPLRAKYIADNYLENARLVNQVRGMLAYTGTYKGKEVTVMSSGMGMPSIGIYAYELYKFYNVDTIIRIGSAGSYTKDLNLYDLILVEKAYTDSSFAFVYDKENINIMEADSYLNTKIEATALKSNIKLTKGIVHSTDVFYNNLDINELYKNNNCLAGEMESFALFYLAKKLNKKASCLLTVSNNLITKEETTSLERQTSFDLMIKLALESTLVL